MIILFVAFIKENVMQIIFKNCKEKGSVKVKYIILLFPYLS